MIELHEAGVSVRLSQPGKQPEKVLLAPTTLSLSESRIALIGANGSGKSTFLQLLNGLIVPTTGQVSVNGFDTARDGRKVRQIVGFVFTDPMAQLVLATPADDVELSLRKRIPRREERRSEALRLLGEQGLADVAEQSVYDLSGGERQLAALTSVLASGPSILVADEPTTLLDLRNRDRIHHALATLDQQVVIATHDLELASTADRVLVIDQAHVVVDDAPGPAINAYINLARS